MLSGPTGGVPGTGSVDLLMWLWGLDTNSQTFLAGFPFPPGGAVPSEYFVIIFWDGSGFTGQLIDRTPLLTGGEAIVTPLALTIDSAELKTSVNAGLVGDPSAFLWIARTGDWKKPLGTTGPTAVDVAPDNGVFVPWPW